MSGDIELTAEYYALERRLREAPSSRERTWRVAIGLLFLGLAALGLR